MSYEAGRTETRRHSRPSTADLAKPRLASLLANWLSSLMAIRIVLSANSGRMPSKHYTTSRKQMRVTITDRVKHIPEGFGLVQHATERLEEVLGQSTGLVSAEWDRSEDEKGRTLYTLRLNDFTGEVVARFAPDELRSSAQTDFRIYRLWGDLLQARNQKQLESLTGAGA